jgi:hypothetical protein
MEKYHFASPAQAKAQPNDRDRIPGIAVHNGYYCPVTLSGGQRCCETYRKTSSLYEHVKKIHRSATDRPKEADLIQYTCECQTVFSENRAYFRIKTGSREPLQHQTNPYETFVQKEASTALGSRPKPMESLRNEELPSLLRVSQWHEFVGGYRKAPEDVVGLIEPPSRSWNVGDSSEVRALGKLPRISQAWLAKVCRFWKDSTEWMRRILDGYPMSVSFTKKSECVLTFILQRQ